MMGDEGLYSGLKKEFKFGEKLGIELPGEEAGIFPSPKYWSKKNQHELELDMVFHQQLYKYFL